VTTDGVLDYHLKHAVYIKAKEDAISGRNRGVQFGTGYPPPPRPMRL